MAPPVHPRLLAVLGDPVEHSLSPPMQNAALQATGLPFVYIAVRVGEGRLRQALEALQLLGARGANVTVPHKETAAALADWLSPEARAAGTVNTILFDGGRIEGYTTDGTGFLRALTEAARFDPTGRRVLLLGAGGAARAVALALAQGAAASVTVVNRTHERAQDLVRRILATWNGTRAETRPWPQDGQAWAELLRGADLVVQATSAGLAGTGAWGEVPFGELPEEALVTDLVYTPRRTAFLEQATQAGRRVLTGDWMLLYQGAEAFRLWTGVDPPVEVMRSALDRCFRQQG